MSAAVARERRGISESCEFNELNCSNCQCRAIGIESVEEEKFCAVPNPRRVSLLLRAAFGCGPNDFA